MCVGGKIFAPNIQSVSHKLAQKGLAGAVNTGFFDMHSHVLSGIDDGAQSFEESCAMIKMAWDQGVRGICATPHYVLGESSFCMDQSVIRQREEELRQWMGTAYPQMRLYSGNELLYEAGAVEELTAKRVRTYNGSRYILVEFMPDISYKGLYGAVGEIFQSAHIPVLAHMERYRCLWNHDEYIKELKLASVLFQMNVSSILGNFMNASVRYCRRLIKDGYIDLLGTDMHNCTTRPPCYAQAAAWIKKNCGEDALIRMSRENPMKVLSDQLID